MVLFVLAVDEVICGCICIYCRYEMICGCICANSQYEVIDLWLCLLW